MKKEKQISWKDIVNIKRIITVLVVFVLIAVMVFSNPEMQKFLFGQNSVKITLQSGADYDAVVYGNEMLLVSNEGVRAIDKNGKDTWMVVNAVTSPQTMVKDNYYMVADINGNAVNVYKKDKSFLQIKTQNEILTAKLNKNGYVAVATDQLGYKGAVLVYDKKGKEVFKWYSGSGYIGDIDISPDGKRIAVAQLMTDKAQVYSRILVINTKSDSDAKTISEIQGIVVSLKYKDNGEILAVCDSGAFCYKKNGKEAFKIDFGGRTPVDFNIENQGNMVFAFDTGLNNTVLESYSSRGRLRGKYETNGAVRAFDVSGEYIMASTVNDVIRISPSGRLKSSVNVGHDVKEIKIFSGRSKFLSLGGRAANILKVK